MCGLLLTLLISGLFEAPETNPQATVHPRDIHCDQQMAPVVLLADGRSDWPGQAASRIADELRAELGSCRPSAVARFDAGPALHTRLAVPGVSRGLLVEPRTPMREAMEAGFAWLIDTPSPHAMVVIAHGQFYPTILSQGRLLELAGRTQTTVHTIHLAPPPTRSGVFRRVGRSLRNAVPAVEVLGFAERQDSARDTARFLKAMSDATGGKACVTTDKADGIDCAKAVAAEILGRPR